MPNPAAARAANRRIPPIAIVNQTSFAQFGSGIPPVDPPEVARCSSSNVGTQSVNSATTNAGTASKRPSKRTPTLRCSGVGVATRDCEGNGGGRLISGAESIRREDLESRIRSRNTEKRFRIATKERKERKIIGKQTQQALRQAVQSVRSDVFAFFVFLAFFCGYPLTPPVLSSVSVACVANRMNNATVSPPVNRMKSAPSPWTRLSRAKCPLLPRIIWTSCTPLTGENPKTLSWPGSWNDSASQRPTEAGAHT